MSRVFNFNAGPAALPQAVLEEVRDGLLDWKGSGLSVMEMSHRAEPFMTIAAEAEADLRSLLSIPDSYRVLFMQGGATGQFAFVPMNLLGGKSGADYVVTGAWSQKAAKEAGKYCTVNVAAQPEGGQFTGIPEASSWKRDPAAAYLHYTSNETIHGVEFQYAPEVANGVPLVADFSSNFLSRPVDVTRHGLIYAGAQKNAGPAGVTIVIVREDLFGKTHPALPTVFDYRAVAEKSSMLNTPPTFPWYVAGLVFKWVLAQGGLAGIEAINQHKSGLLYDYIDGEPFYANPIAKADRSRMNVVFTLADSALDKAFVAGARDAGMIGVKGHRSVGGMRASLYNAVPEAAVAALIDYMKEFVRRRS